MKIELPQLHKVQQDIKDLLEKERTVVVASGRRSGKSQLAKDLLIYYSLMSGDVSYYTPSYKMLLTVFDELSEILAPIARYDRQNKRIFLPDSRIDFWSLDKHIADRVRGKKYCLAVLDEAAFIPSLIDSFQKVISPTLIDLRGKAIFFSSPNGRNDFFILTQEYPTLTATSYDNPHIPRDEIDRLKKSLPERVFRQEILAEFIETDMAVFSGLDEVSGIRDVPSGLCSIGVDIGRSNDNTVISVIRDSHLVDLGVFHDNSFSLITQHIVEYYKKYKPDVMIIEENGLAMPVIEDIANQNIPIDTFVTSLASKKVLIEDLIVAIEQKLLTVDTRLKYYDMLINELSTFESKRTSTGQVTYSAPSGMHDDTVMSLALAYRGIKSSGSLVF